MNSRNTIQDELNDLGSTLPFDIKQPVFAVPEGYFENFAASVWRRIKSQHPMNSAEEIEQLSPVLAAIPRKMPFTLPEDYFSSLAENIPATAGDPTPQFLLQHSRQMPYQVPAGYFDHLPQAILNKTARPQARVVGFTTARWMRYAAAAVVTGFIALSTILYFRNDPSADMDAAVQNGEWVAKNLKTVSNQELEEFIRNTDVSLTGASLAKSSGINSEIRKLLKDVPNKELDAFLEAVPTDNEELADFN